MLTDLFLLRTHSPTVLHRSERLLRFTLGMEAAGTPITVATMLARQGLDPHAAAQRLNCLGPADAVHHLAAVIARAEIDGAPCPDPRGLAREALSFAGRAV